MNYTETNYPAEEHSTVEGLVVRARQILGAARDLQLSYAGLIYGPAPVAQTSPETPVVEDRLDAADAILRTALDELGRLEAEMRRRQ